PRATWPSIGWCRAPRPRAAAIRPPRPRAPSTPARSRAAARSTLAWPSNRARQRSARQTRGDAGGDARLVADRADVAVEGPALDVLDLAAGRQCDQRAQGLDLQDVGVGVRLEVAAPIRIGGAGLIVDPLDEQIAVAPVAEPSALVRQADLELGLRLR